MTSEVDDEECVCTEKEERRLQRKFIERHLTNRPKKLKHKFLRELTSSRSSGLKHKRSAGEPTAEAEEVPVVDVLKQIAEEEIDEVDIIMEDITEEIHDLQVGIQ